MKVIITKWALTKGPVVEDVVQCGNPKAVKSIGYLSFFWGEGREWHRTKESAEQRILEMIGARRFSLEKQLTELDDKKAKALKQLSEFNLE